MCGGAPGSFKVRVMEFLQHLQEGAGDDEAFRLVVRSCKGGSQECEKA